MATKNDLIKLAESELGYVEKSASAFKKYGTDCLYTKAGNAGSDNLTKYAYETGHYKIVGWAAWCQTFIAYIFLKTFKKELANKLLCGKLMSASTMEVKNAFLAKGRGVPLKDAQPGDIVYRSRNGGGHVGLVKGWKNGKIWTIEGNSSSTDISSWNGGAVVEHVGATWQWCCRPDYSLVVDDKVKISEEYSIGVGREGLTLTDNLHLRKAPKNGQIIKTLMAGEHIYPNKKVFVEDKNGTTIWYGIPDLGWVSAHYCEGWVYEADKDRWWFVRKGYTNDWNDRVRIGNHYYYFDVNGYAVSSTWVEFEDGWRYYDRDCYEVAYCYVKSKSSRKYYFIGEDGIWVPELDTTQPDTVSFKVISE